MLFKVECMCVCFALLCFASCCVCIFGRRHAAGWRRRRRRSQFVSSVCGNKLKLKMPQVKLVAAAADKRRVWLTLGWRAGNLSWNWIKTNPDCVCWYLLWLRGFWLFFASSAFCGASRILIWACGEKWHWNLCVCVCNCFYFCFVCVCVVVVLSDFCLASSWVHQVAPQAAFGERKSKRENTHTNKLTLVTVLVLHARARKGGKQSAQSNC